MWQYIVLLLRRQLGGSMLASGGFLLTACTLILLSATTQTTVVQATQIINQNWRPTYDLVVLPAQAKVPAGENIPADLLQGYDGGISIQQYEQIKHLPQIEVAAPIAYIGYIALPSPTIYLPRNYPEGYYQLTWTLNTFDGQRHLVEYQKQEVIYQPPNPCQGGIENTQQQIALFQALEKQGIEYLGCGGDGHPILTFSSPDTGTFLLAAIDPDAESQLLHLDKSVTSGRMLTAQDTLHVDERMPAGYPVYNEKTHQTKTVPIQAIPMLLHQQLPGQITLNLQFTQLKQGTMTLQQLQALGGVAYLTRLHSQQVMFNIQVPLVQNNPQRFSGTDLQWNGHTWQIIPPLDPNYDPLAPFLLNFAAASTPSSLTYQPATAPDGSSAYKLVPAGAQGPEVAFRTLSPLQTLQKPMVDAVYTYQVVGQFNDDKLVAQLDNPLNWLPENTYTVPPIVRRYNAQGQPVTPTPLLPTTNSAGYVMQPPLALTTLAAAQKLIGNNLISAIRIRVSGIDRADPTSWKRIQAIAQMIEQRTGLHVLVTLGSSPKSMLVYVPGLKKGQDGAKQDIAPIGWVEELWISLGASIVYLAQLSATRLLLLAAVLIVCLGYLVVTFSMLASTQRKEFAVLSALGWRPWQPIRLFLTQALILALGGGIAGLALALLIATLLGATPIWLIVVWTLPLILVLACISVLYPLWQLWHIRPADILRTGSSISSARSIFLGFHRWIFVSPLESMAMRNLSRSRPRTLISIGSLFFTTVLLMLMFNGILALHQTLMGTLLGNSVLLQTAIPQIAGCVFAVLLTFLSVADLFLLQARERRQELGLLQATGWRMEAVRRLFVQEGITLAIIGAIPGVLASWWILLTQHSIQSIIPFPLLALSSMLFIVLVAALATLPALSTLNRMQMAYLLRAE